MKKFDVGDRVIAIRSIDDNPDVKGKVGTIRKVSIGDYLPYAVEFEDFTSGHNIGGLAVIDHRAGWNCDEGSLQLVGPTGVTAMDGIKKARLEEIGDSIIAKKAPLTTLTVATEYRSSMAASAAIKPSMKVRLGRPLTVQGVRIY